MAIQLTEEQRKALHAQPNEPIRVVDPHTNQTYVLVQEKVYVQVQSLLQDDLSDTYAAQVDTAMKAGWDDPKMDEYNDYDKHRDS